MPYSSSVLHTVYPNYYSSAQQLENFNLGRRKRKITMTTAIDDEETSLQQSQTHCQVATIHTLKGKQALHFFNVVVSVTRGNN